jgi:hypothetical protein
MKMNLESLSLNPVYIAPSAWWQHVPIAHWLIWALKPGKVVELGSHYGVSFFAFCEAAQAFSPDTFVYAIDTWGGDEHAGFYEEDVYSRVVANWDKYHSTRSLLVRSTFDSAVEYFEDRSIDILHIDGLHTYDAVRHDYDKWLPKMKEESIVIFHDINVRERGFGVWKLWLELNSKFPSFQVLNGHGLGILVFGDSTLKRLEDFPCIINILQAKGQLLERLALLTPGGTVGCPPLDQARIEIEQAKVEAEQAKAEAARALQTVSQITNSRFWRFSSPVRSFLARLKRLLRSPSS